MTEVIVQRKRNFSKYLEGAFGLSEEEIWSDIKKESLINLKTMIEIRLENRVQEQVGRRWAHDVGRKYYRNGHYVRSLLTSQGFLDIRMPRLRNGKIVFEEIERYKRRTKETDQLILNMFLAGISTRRVEEALRPIIGPKAISAGLVSQITKVLTAEVKNYHTKAIDDRYEYLILDGIYVNSKSPGYKRRRCILVAYGLWKEKGELRREIIDFEMAWKGESENAWSIFLHKLYHRGLTGKKLRLITIDGNAGLKNAAENIYPLAKIQKCWAHKLRNVSKRLSKRLGETCVDEASEIYNAKNYKEAIKAYKRWSKFWRTLSPEAVNCLEEDIDYLLNFFREPKELWKKIRTTNIIERSFREVRRRIRPMSCFQNTDSVERIIFAIFYRLNDVWKKA